GILEAGRRVVADDVGIERRLAAGDEDFDRAGTTTRAERARRKIGLSAAAAALEPQFAGLAALPEVLRLGGLPEACGKSGPSSRRRPSPRASCNRSRSNGRARRTRGARPGPRRAAARG